MYKINTLQNEFEKNKELDQTNLDSLKHWCSKQAHLPAFPDELLAVIFHSCNYEIELTKTTIDNYFTIRSHVPEFFDNRNPFSVNVKDGKPIVHYAVLNGRTPEGYKVVIMKLNNTDPSCYVFSDQIKAFNMLLDVQLLLHGSFPGLVVVFDMEGTTFGHVSRISVVQLKKILYYVQEAMPVRLRGVHYINAVSFMDVILGMMKPFLKKSLLDLLHVHAQGMDSFYKFIPKEILPSDLGGKDFSTEELHKKAFKVVQDHEKWIKEESVLRVDESKRVGKAKSSDLFGMEGSFKKLNLD